MIRRPPISTLLSLHDALPISTIIFMFIIFFSLNGWMALTALACIFLSLGMQFSNFIGKRAAELTKAYFDVQERSEEHTSELQSRQYLVCRLLLEKKTE